MQTQGRGTGGDRGVMHESEEVVVGVRRGSPQSEGVGQRELPPGLGTHTQHKPFPDQLLPPPISHQTQVQGIHKGLPPEQ